MRIPWKKRITGMRKVLQAYKIIENRLPSTYPRPLIILHLNQDQFHQYWKTDKLSSETYDYLPDSFIDTESGALHIHLGMWEDNMDTIISLLLHELGHLMAFQRFKSNDPRNNDTDASEKYAWTFSNRWYKIMKKEGLF